MRPALNATWKFFKISFGVDKAIMLAATPDLAKTGSPLFDMMSAPPLHAHPLVKSDAYKARRLSVAPMMDWTKEARFTE